MQSGGAPELAKARGIQRARRAALDQVPHSFVARADSALLRVRESTCLIAARLGTSAPPIQRARVCGQARFPRAALRTGPVMASCRHRVSRTPYRFVRTSLARLSLPRPRNYAKFEVALAARNRRLRDIATHSCVLYIGVKSCPTAQRLGAGGNRRREYGPLLRSSEAVKYQVAGSMQIRHVSARNRLKYFTSLANKLPINQSLASFLRLD
jgi:hypothetical protein